MPEHRTAEALPEARFFFRIPKTALRRTKNEFELQCRSLKNFRAEFRGKCGFTTRKSSSNSNSIFPESTPCRECERE